MGSKGIDAAIIGEVTKEERVVLVKKNGAEEEIPIPEQDHFWLLFFKTLEILRKRSEEK